ncbi:MAG: hypothetical protein PF487_04470 [Bacteroidales bacterium]|jgi:hypothetical protein|nr:hypothetical protein [Bacteroidales bacterium]
MEVITTLEKSLTKVIGIEVTLNDDIVGEVIEYDRLTGRTIIKITSEPVWKTITGNDIGLVHKSNVKDYCVIHDMFFCSPTIEKDDLTLEEADNLKSCLEMETDSYSSFKVLNKKENQVEYKRLKK